MHFSILFGHNNDHNLHYSLVWNCIIESEAENHWLASNYANSIGNTIRNRHNKLPMYMATLYYITMVSTSYTVTPSMVAIHAHRMCSQYR